MPDTIVFGIDFGTTFSGVAWAFTSKPSEIELVTSWESSTNVSSDVHKAPSKLLASNIDNDIEWGYGIRSDDQALQWFKLLLLNSADVPASLASSEQYVKAQKIQDRIGKDPVEIVASYLLHLWTHAIKCIKLEKGALLVDSCKFRIVITVPAIWPQYATNRMRKASEIAGLLDLRLSGETVLDFITEPEAAALATISDMNKRDDIKKGDTIVICDAGGGTVDLISYMVKNCSPFVFDEHVKGEGGLCGGIFVDENFEKFIRKKVGDDAWENADPGRRQKTMHDEWEHSIKRRFEGAHQNRPWLITLPEKCTVQRPGDSRKRTRDLFITTAELMSIFDPVADQVVELVANQVKEIQRKSSTSPKFIILVGGFGRSPLLFTQLRDANPFSTVLQSRGSGPWTAICRGAVMRGLATDPSCKMAKVPAAIGARIARHSYGTLSNQIWDQKKHKGTEKTWDAFVGLWRANEQAEWFLKKGETFSPGKTSKHGYERHFSDNDETIEPIEEELYISSADRPPRQNCIEVELLCSIKWNKDISIGSLPKRVSPGGEVYRLLQYQIHVTFGGAALDVAVYHKGKRVGDKSVSVDFEDKNYSVGDSEYEDDSYEGV